MPGLRRPYRALLLAALLVGCLSGQGIAAPFIRESDDRQKAVELPAKPERIISLAPTNTEILFALGLDKEVVGVTRYCDYPEAAKQKEKIGAFVNFDLPRIRALHPDLVLAFGTMQLPDVEALEKSGIRVFWLYPRTVDDILRSFERVGRMTGKAEEGRRLRVAVEKEISALRIAFGSLPDEKRPTVLRVMGFNRPATIGADSFQTDLFSVAGGRNAFPAEGKDYFEMSADELLKGDPSMVLVCGEDEQKFKEKVKDSPVYNRLPAVKKGAILVLPCELTCRPGPRIGETARRLSQSLHPGK